jgi:hypothetical protein
LVIFRKAELGFFSVLVEICRHTPYFWGHLPCNARILCWKSLSSMVASKDFAPWKLGQMIHLNLVVKGFKDILFFSPRLLKCAPNPWWFCHHSISHKIKYETIFTKKKVKTLIIHKNSCNFSKCDNKIKKFKYTCHNKSFFGFKICTKYEK